MPQTVGVLALQGAFGAHVDACRAIGVEAVEVRTADQLARCDRIIIPGGESTTMSMMLDRNELREPLAACLADGMPAFGTCAGMILLASEVSDGRPDQRGFAMIDISVRRNGYGRQNQSFSDGVDIASLAIPATAAGTDLIPPEQDAETGDFHAVFIRAPRVERIGADVDVLALYGDEPVLCQQASVLVAAFHPELSPDRRLHRYFCGVASDWSPQPPRAEVRS